MTIYTYIGNGESSPQMINFMGKQEFMLGEPVEVTNEILLAKIKGNHCFKEGEIDRKAIVLDQKKAINKATERRNDDKVVNARALKQRK